MEKTRIPLQKWFAGIALICNAKKSLSSYQLSHNLKLNQPSAWYMQQRIRAALASDQAPMLAGIIESDLVYVGGKSRKASRKYDDKQNKRGRGTDKTPIIGAVERDGNVIAQVAEDLTGKSKLNFIKQSVKTEDSVLVTDEYKT